VALPEEEREALCFSRGMPRNLAVHRLLSKSTQKKPDLLELPAYSMRFTFSHFSLSSNATNVSCSAKGDELKIVRTNFQCRVRFRVSTDNVNRMQSEVKDAVVPATPLNLPLLSEPNEPLSVPPSSGSTQRGDRTKSESRGTHCSSSRTRDCTLNFRFRRPSSKLVCAPRCPALPFVEY